MDSLYNLRNVWLRTAAYARLRAGSTLGDGTLDEYSFYRLSFALDHDASCLTYR